MKWADVVRLGKELPEVEEGIWYRTPSLRVRGKSFVRLKEDLDNVVFLLESVEAQELLCEAMPAVYHITDHYRGYAAVLARLSALRATECRQRLLESWQQKAPRKLISSLTAPAKRGR